MRFGRPGLCTSADPLSASTSSVSPTCASLSASRPTTCRWPASSRSCRPIAWLSIDLSHLGLDVDRHGCTRHLAAIAARLPPGARVQVGAEDHHRADAVLACVSGVAGQGLADRLGATVQATFAVRRKTWNA